jgi:integrase
MAETGLRPIEIHTLKVRDLNVNESTITPTTAKHGAARTIHIPPELSQTFQRFILKNDRQTNQQIFNNKEPREGARQFGNHFRDARKRLAKRLNDPSLLAVRLYDFRHYHATMTYWKLRDIGLTAYEMGHKNWLTTQKYVHLVRVRELNKKTEWDVEETADKDRAKELLKANFTYIMTTPDGIMMFRRPK